MPTIPAILTAAASGPNAVTALCAPLSDDDLRAETSRLSDVARGGCPCGSCREARKSCAALEIELTRRSAP